MEVDAYRIAAAATAAVANSATATLQTSASNAYTSLLAAQEWMGNKKVPMEGRICFCLYSFYNFLKLDDNFVMASDIAMEKRINGQMGEVDGVKIVPVPSTYMPANHAFVLIHPSALLACDKMEDYKTHDNPPGISGALIEGRVRYDAFAVTAKKDGLYAHKNA